jgi:hypothetical protein
MEMTYSDGGQRRRALIRTLRTSGSEDRIATTIATHALLEGTVRNVQHSCRCQISQRPPELDVEVGSN